MIILPIHIIIAFSSVAFTTFAYFAPSRAKLYTSYGLIGLTLISGTDLVVVSRARIISACTSGLIYVGIMTVGLYATQRKLVINEARDHKID